MATDRSRAIYIYIYVGGVGRSATLADILPIKVWQQLRWSLSGPISRDTAILSLRYPISRDTFQGRLALPQYDAIPLPLRTKFHTGTSVRYPILQHIARYLCDTPQRQARKSFAILSLQVSRGMKGIAIGPLRMGENNARFKIRHARASKRDGKKTPACGKMSAKERKRKSAKERK